MARKNITVSRERESGLNTHFKVPGQGEITRGEFANQIERGKHPDYHVVRDPQGRRIPRSNPDGSRNNNLDYTWSH